ncbi:MAG: hypothetical protein KC423_01945 [Anaerolineales bacterium]|nr:hypothetical protein [Anaerolineales bacterium]
MNFTSLLSLIADIIGILGAIFALFAWLQARALKQAADEEKNRQNKKVQVVLQHGGKRIELPVQLRRIELTRSEILGRIGMLPLTKKGGRFSLDYLSTPQFLQQINQISGGQEEENVLTISCTEEEFNQFDLERITI